MRRYAEVFKGLADETRLVMLALVIRHGELCVCDFVEALGVTQSKASRHLRYLRNAGLLDDRRDGAWVHYRVAAEPDQEALAVLDAVRGLVAQLVPAGVEERLAAWTSEKARSAACSCRPAGDDPGRCCGG